MTARATVDPANDDYKAENGVHWKLSECKNFLYFQFRNNVANVGAFVDVDGTLKWDGCMDFEMQDSHWCHPIDRAKKFTAGINKVLAIAEREMPEYEVQAPDSPMADPEAVDVTWLKLTKHRGSCFCTGACHPPPLGAGRCVAAPPTIEELRKNIKLAVAQAEHLRSIAITHSLDSHIPFMNINDALVDAYFALEKMVEVTDGDAPKPRS